MGTAKFIQNLVGELEVEAVLVSSQFKLIEHMVLAYVYHLNRLMLAILAMAHSYVKAQKRLIDVLRSDH